MSKRKFKAEILVEEHVFEYDEEYLEGMTEDEILEMAEEDAINNTGYQVTEL